MRIRTVKPALFTSAVVSSWPDDVFRTFIGLYCYVDDHGRGEDDTDLLKAAVWPRVKRMTTTKIEAHLALLAVPGGPVCRYDSEGVRMLHVVEWNTKGSDYYQQVNKRLASVLPTCPKHEPDGLFP
jgi:hypothetical protein